MEERFDVIVVGGGLAGLSAAYRLSKHGRSVLVLEKGRACGAKNVSGGRIYTYALEALMPGAWKEAPLERKITHESLMMMDEQDAMTIDTTVHALEDQSYSVLRQRFDGWLASQCEKEGAMVVEGATVNAFHYEAGRIAGVRVGEETLKANLVIDAEGANPILAEQAGIIKPIQAESCAVSVKYIIRLGEDKINERFNLASDEGVAMLGLGSANKGLFGGMFLYTNKDTLSVGLVQDTQSWKKRGMHLPDAIEDLKSHPQIGRYLKDGEVVEYTAHIIPEGGYHAMSSFCADGALIVGDAAGLCLNRGYTVRGMDYAIMSGIAAAETANHALEYGVYTKDFLSSYTKRLEEGVLKDFKTLSGTHEYMATSPYLFAKYPRLALQLMHNVYKVDGTPARKVWRLAKDSVKDLSLVGVAKDLLKGVRSL